jgi:CO/xanthine dehydrogenase Mo-binding subunit
MATGRSCQIAAGASNGTLAGSLLFRQRSCYSFRVLLRRPHTTASYQEARATTNPLGLRGLGECGNPGPGGAIANAVSDALRDRGVGITALPLTPALVFAAIRDQVTP